MCGIAGYVGLHPDLGRDTLIRMAAAQAHRGPDGEGFAIHDGFGFAHVRLAIIDLAGGAQPITSPDGRFVMTYNGEVYNFRELRCALADIGYRFETSCDTEVVLAAWRRWGSGCFDRFNGMFALAIGDTKTGEVILARDQFGIKPLYFTTSGTRVLFASEIGSLLAGGVQARPDDVTVYRYLRFRVHDDGERTFFSGVHRVMPGEIVTISPDGATHRRIYTSLYGELKDLAANPQPYDNARRE